MNSGCIKFGVDRINSCQLDRLEVLDSEKDGYLMQNLELGQLFPHVTEK